MGRASGRKSCSGKRCEPGGERKNEQHEHEEQRLDRVAADIFAGKLDRPDEAA